ncbi:hypothetical protein IJJ08_01020 [bacterium]|nr:hypothetical protein [bacterium]
MTSKKTQYWGKFILLESILGGFLIALARPCVPIAGAQSSVAFSLAPAVSPAGSIAVETNSQTLLSRIITLVIVVAALLALYNLIMGAIDYINSGGDKSKTEEARGRIIAAVIGLLVLASVWAIFNLVVTVGFGGASNLNIQQF